MMSYFLHTERLGFRLWHEDDLELAIGLWGDIKVTSLFDARGRWSDAEVKDRLALEINTYELYGVQYWPIFQIRKCEHVGCCGLRPYDLDGKIYEIGFHIRSAYWGQGYATEAALAVIDYAFDVLNVNGLFAGHNPQNEASRRVLNKLGFRYTHDAYYEPTGLSHPSYELTREAYNQIRVNRRR